MGKKEGDALEISFDYTTPTYRDCSAGRFLYAKLAEEGYKKFICKKATEGHKSYLEKMGICERKRRLCKERIVQIGVRKFLSSSVNEYKTYQPIPFNIHTL